MNLNTAVHIMDYLTRWEEGNDIGSSKSGLTKDYINETVWNIPVNNIAIVYHQGVFKNILLVFVCI